MYFFIESYVVSSKVNTTSFQWAAYTPSLRISTQLDTSPLKDSEDVK